MSESSIGDLLVRIGSDTTGLVRGLNDSSSRISKLSAQIRQQGNDFIKYGALATAAGAAIGGKLVKDQLALIDSTAKTADKLGIATERLGGLRYAAELSGVASNTLDMALQRMTRRLAEAAGGTGEAKDALKELRLDAQALAGMSPDEQFYAIADAMTEVGSQSDRVRLAFKLFDSEGVSLVNTLASGAAGLAQMQEEADKLGVTITRIDAAKVEAANDAMTRAGAVIQGVVRRAAVDLAPVIEAISNEFVNTAAETENFGTAAFDAVRSILTPINWLLDGVHGIKVAIKGVEVVFRGLAYGAVADINMIARGWVELANLIPGIDVDYSKTFLGELETSVSDALKSAQGELHELAMQTIPSERIENWLTKVEAASAAAAEKIASNRKAILDGNGESAGEKKGEKDKDDPVAKLLERFATEEQLTRDFYEKMAQLEQARADGRIATESEFLQMKNQLILEDQQNMRSLDEAMTQHSREQAEQRRQLAEWEAQARTQAMSQMWTDLGSLMNSKSRKMFEIGKAAAISETILSTYSSAQKSYDALAGIPVVGPALGTAAAAAAIASGLTRVQAIQSTSFGSKSGAGIGGSGAVNGGVTSGESGAPARTVTIQGISPDAMFSGRQLIQLINEAQEDGAKLVIQ